MVEMQKEGNDHFKRIESYMKEYQSIEKDIDSLRKENEGLKKDIAEWKKNNNIILSKLDMFKKTDEEIQSQIERLIEKDESMKDEIAKLGNTLEEQIEAIKDLVKKENEIMKKIDQLDSNQQNIHQKAIEMEESQKKMMSSINSLSNEVKDQYKNLTLQDQQIIQKQVQLGLMQKVTNDKILHIEDSLLSVKTDILAEIKKTQLIAQYSKYIDNIGHAAYAYRHLNRFEFGIIKKDERLDEFMKKTTNNFNLEYDILEVFNMILGEKAMINKSIFEQWDGACDSNVFMYFVRLLYQGISLKKISLRIEEKDLRYVLVSTFRFFLLYFEIPLKIMKIIPSYLVMNLKKHGSKDLHLFMKSSLRCVDAHMDIHFKGGGKYLNYIKI